MSKTRKTTKARSRKRQTITRFKRYAQTPRGKYTRHKRNAKVRGIAFEMTYAEWLAVWEESGHFDKRGNKTSDGYVMARKDDRGPYAVGNVSIKSNGANVAERNRNFAYARRAGIPWDWFLNGPPQEMAEELPDLECPF